MPVVYILSYIQARFLLSVNHDLFIFEREKNSGIVKSSTFNVENILKGSLDLIPSPSVKIQIMNGKNNLR